MVSAFASSPISQPRAKVDGADPIGARAFGVVRRRRKETVNERVEHILRGALCDAEEEALQEREGDAETRGRALQRSHQLASLYATSTENKFLHSRAKRSALLERSLEEKAKQASESSQFRAGSRAGPDYAVTAIGEIDESDESDDGRSSMRKLVLASPIKGTVSCGSTSDLASRSPVSLVTSPVKPRKPWYNCSPNASLKQQIPPGITLDAKLRRYGARGTAKLVHGWRSVDALEPLSPSHPVVPVDEFAPGLRGSPSLWPPETFHPSGSRLPVTITRCPSSPIAVSVEVDSTTRSSEPCKQHVDIQQALQLKAAQKLQLACQREAQAAREQRVQNQQDMSEWQTRTLHFDPPPELAAHRQQRQSDPQIRHRRTPHTAIVQTPGYSPEKQRQKESHDLCKKRFSLRWRSFAKLLDAMRRTPCRRPVLKDMEKLFALARELCALNALGSCTLSRSQFVLLITREFPLCDVKYVNRLFSSYDWDLCDSLDARIVLGTVRAMRVQQGEPVELICASLRDFDGSSDVNGEGTDESKAVVSDAVCLKKAFSLCCSSNDEEQDMASRAVSMWTKLLSWQRQILSRRLNGGVGYNVWKASGTWSSSSSSALSRGVDATSFTGDDEVSSKTQEEDNGKEIDVVDEEDSMEDLSVLLKLVDESRVPVRRVRAALKREKHTLRIFTQQLVDRRHECMLNADKRSARR